MCKKFMKRALELAGKFEGQTSPNPMVGAVLVKDGVIIGEGAHEKAGQPHAEVNAIRNATCSPKGSTLYVTLEPCSHYGKTPPCADLIIESGVTEVYIAMTDPNPLVNGRGIMKMQKAEITVHVGMCEEEAKQLNEQFICNVTKKRPFVSLKSALSLDGKIATSTMDSKWITNELSRTETHRIRNIHDAIIIGKNTFLSDNPSMNVRFNQKTGQEPDKIVLADSFLGDREFVENCNAYKTLNGNKLYIAFPESCGDDSSELETLDSVELIRFNSLDNLMKQLFDLGVMSVMLEGGSGLYNSFIKANLVDKYYLFIAPLILGNEGIGWSGDHGINKVEHAKRLQNTTIKQFEDDTLLIIYPEES